MKIVTLTKKDKILKGEINLPASKSISNRALIINYLIDGKLHLHNLSVADDTILMKHLLQEVSETGIIDTSTELNCENAGTVMRFLTALLATTHGNWILTGSERMKERPISILVQTLIELGAEIKYLDQEGFPPVEINGKNLMGGKVKIDGSVSSQYISALLLIAPVLENGLLLTLANKISSKPYIDMTLRILNHFGIDYTFKNQEIEIKHQEFKAKDLHIEADWSAAAFWYEIVALAEEADIVLKDLKCSDPTAANLKSGFINNHISLQGDSILPEIYKSFGVKTEILDRGIRLIKTGNPVSEFEFDFANNPDLAQAVIVTCAALGIKGTFTGLNNLRIKETDRLKALGRELYKLGFETKEIGSSVFEVRSCKPISIKSHKSNIIHTYGDHRMAMAFAPLSLIYNNLIIENPQVVSKSYPNFWKDLNKVGLDTSFR